ncbi:benzoate 4-monooxygenase [Microdochium nivale]|nr:benzoate 4-monooxygenase [Microdochium nivale]
MVRPTDRGLVFFANTHTRREPKGRRRHNANMHVLLLVGVAAAAGLLLNACVVLYRAISSPTRLIPGPAVARFTRLWYLDRVRRGGFHHDNIQLHAEHGPIVRVAPGRFSIATPDKAVYGIGSRFRKSDWYQGWKHPSPDRWTLFPDQDVARHADTRRRFQALYSLSSLLSYEAYVDECDALLCDRLSAVARAGEAVDLAHWLQCFAFDVMGSVTYSRRFGFLDRGDDISGIIAALDRSMAYSTLVGIYAWAHPYLYAVMEKIPGSGAAGRNYLMGFVRKRIQERNEKRSKIAKAPPPMVSMDAGELSEGGETATAAPRDFLDKLTDAHEQDPRRVTPYHIFMMGLSNIIAGSDTTAISLSSVLYRLITTPRAMAKLRAEAAEAAIQNSGSGRGKISFKTANEDMPYLRAVIKEGLRMHPATGLPLWRVVPEGGAVVAGQRFEAGDVVGLNSWVAHYDRSVFGDDADVFRPERWLEAEAAEDPERYRKMEAHYMPFGLGSRTCLGRHISTLEMSKLIPELVTRFDFELAMDESDWKAKNFWFVKPERLSVRVTSRKIYI